MKEEILRTIYVTRTLDAYRGFFSDDWGERIEQLTRTKPRLSEIVFDILMEWRAAAYTASLPVCILEHMKGYHDGFVNSGDINTQLLHLAETIPRKLAQEIPELCNDPALVRRLRGKLVDIGAEVERARDKAVFEFPLEETWQSYLQDNVYQLSLWGSQRICFVSIYNSYENFLVRAVSIARLINSCRTTDKDFQKNLVESFGQKLRDMCWTANDINIARLARHALSHAGGRVTDSLANQDHGFEVRDGRIQVTPEKTKELFSLLKDCVYSLAETAATMSQFQ